MDIIARVILDTAQAVSAFEDLTNEADKLGEAGQKSVSKFKEHVGSLTKTFLSVQAAMSAARFATDEFKEALAQTKLISDLNQSLGITTQMLSGLSQIAKLADVNLESFAISISQLDQKAITFARTGTGELADAFVQLGISQKGIQPLLEDNELLLEVVANQFSKMADGVDKANIATKLFGEAGLKLIPILNRGAKGIEEISAQASSFGKDLTANQIKAVVKLDEAWKSLEGRLEGLFTQISADMSPFLTGIVDVFDFLLKSVNSARIGFLIFTNTVAKAIWQLKGELNLGDSAKEIEYYEGVLENLRKQLEQTWNPETADNIDKIKAASRGLAAETNRFTEEQMNQYNALKLLNQAREEMLTPDAARFKKLQEQYDNRNAIIENALTYQLITDQQAKELMLQNEEAYQRQLSNTAKDGHATREEYAAMSMKNQATTIFGELANITAGVSQHNKRLFQINKIAGIANAIIHTYEGVTETLGKYPWPLAGVMAAIHLAAGMAQVQAIRSTSYGSGAASGGIPSGGGSIPQTNVTNPLGNFQQQAAGSAVNVYVTVQGNVTSERDLVRTISEALGSQINSNDWILINPDSAQAHVLRR